MALTAEQEMQRNALAQQLMSGTGDPNTRNMVLNEWARLEGMRRDPYSFDPYGSGSGIGQGPNTIATGPSPQSPQVETVDQAARGPSNPYGTPPTVDIGVPQGGPTPQGGGPPSTVYGDPQGQSEPVSSLPDINPPGRGGKTEDPQEPDIGTKGSVEIGELSSPSFNTQGTNPQGNPAATPGLTAAQQAEAQQWGAQFDAVPYADIFGNTMQGVPGVEAPNYGYGPVSAVPGGAFPSTQEAPTQAAPANIEAAHSQFGQVGTNPLGGAVYGPLGTLEGVPYSGYYDATMPQDVQEQGLGYGPPGSIPGGQFGANPLGEIESEDPQGYDDFDGIDGLDGLDGAPGGDPGGMDDQDGAPGGDAPGGDAPGGGDPGGQDEGGQDGPGGQDGQDGQDGPGGSDDDGDDDDE
jgi:hypothetical protein